MRNYNSDRFWWYLVAIIFAPLAGWSAYSEGHGFDRIFLIMVGAPIILWAIMTSPNYDNSAHPAVKTLAVLKILEISVIRSFLVMGGIAVIAALTRPLGEPLSIGYRGFSLAFIVFALVMAGLRIWNLNRAKLDDDKPAP